METGGHIAPAAAGGVRPLAAGGRRNPVPLALCLSQPESTAGGVTNCSTPIELPAAAKKIAQDWPPNCPWKPSEAKSFQTNTFLIEIKPDLANDGKWKLAATSHLQPPAACAP